MKSFSSCHNDPRLSGNGARRLKPLFIVFGACGALLLLSILALTFVALTDQEDGTMGRTEPENFAPSVYSTTLYKENTVANFRYCEFHIAQNDFEALARTRKWKLKAIDRPVWVTRSSNGFWEDGRPHFFRVPTGFVCEDLPPNGSGIAIVFDQMHCMAFIRQSDQ